MDAGQRAAFDADRDVTGKAVASACYAPFTSMYLNPLGDVLACCDNTEHPLGNITERSLREIWQGHATTELRTALTAYDLSVGCWYCAWQIDDGQGAGVPARGYEHLPVVDAVPEWPRRLSLIHI